MLRAVNPVKLRSAAVTLTGSGYGRELSTAAMREFLNAKTVILASPTAR